MKLKTNELYYSLMPDFSGFILFKVEDISNDERFNCKGLIGYSTQTRKWNFNWDHSMYYDDIVTKFSKPVNGNEHNIIGGIFKLK